MDGSWFATYALDVYKNGFTAAELGIKHHNGEKVTMANNEAELAPGEGIGIKANLEGFTATYDD